MFLKILKFSHFTWIINFNKFKFYPKQHYIKKKNLIYNYNNIFSIFLVKLYQVPLINAHSFILKF